MTWLLGADLSGDGHVVWTSPGWLLGAVVAALVLAFAVAARSALRHRPAWPELVPLGLALALVAVAAAGPVWVVEAGRIEPPVTAVLVDSSRSMGVIEDGAPRYDAVDQALAAVGTDRVEVFHFDSDLQVGTPADWTGSSTDLGGALQALSDRYAGEKLAGVVVITDGLDRGGLRRRFGQETEPQLPPLPGPLSLYQIGAPQDLFDLAVTELDSGGFAFVHTPFSLTATLHALGGVDRPIPVTLLADGQPIQSRMVTLDADGSAQVEFELTVRQPGRFLYEIEVPVLDGDAVPGNNRMPVVVRVVRDRIRVLQVCGAPSFDQKFLRLFLKQDPSVDLVSFFILRTIEDTNTTFGNNELSLIQFPYETLFDLENGELDSFDLVIFQNFDYAPFFQADGKRLLGDLEEFVRSGKSFVMIGGDRSFDLGDYAGTPIEEILPVQLGMPVDGATDLDPFEPQLTAQGAHHPVTRLMGSSEDTRIMWDRLPPLDGLNTTVGVQPGSAVLLEHPDLTTADGKPMPVIAVREVGKGRTMALMGDSSWRWVMTEAAQGNGNQAYLRFWKNAIRWLVQDRDAQRVRVDTTRENYVIGDTIRVLTRVRDVGFDPMEGEPVVGRITGPDGASESFEVVTDATGEAVVELEASAVGAWQVEIEAGARGGLGEDRTVFAVTDRDPELEELQPDAAFLQTLAAVSGGAYFPPDAYGPALQDETAGRVVDERKETPLWPAPIVPLAAGVLLSLSWWIRRRRGLR